MKSSGGKALPGVVLHVELVRARVGRLFVQLERRAALVAMLGEVEALPRRRLLPRRRYVVVVLSCLAVVASVHRRRRRRRRLAVQRVRSAVAVPVEAAPVT